MIKYDRGDFMKEIVMKHSTAPEYKKFIALFMQKMNIKVNDMVQLLDVSANTIYNYRTMNDEELPIKVRDKIFNVLEVDSYNQARNLLNDITMRQRDEIVKSLRSLLRSTLLVSQEDSETSNFLEVSSCLVDIGSKVFVEALLYEIKKAINGKDDYEFISYVRKYKGM